eukprot:978792-Amphidinium_carterae.1
MMPQPPPFAPLHPQNMSVGGSSPCSTCRDVCTSLCLGMVSWRLVVDLPALCIVIFSVTVVELD